MNLTDEGIGDGGEGHGNGFGGDGDWFGDGHCGQRGGGGEGDFFGLTDSPDDGALSA